MNASPPFDFVVTAAVALQLDDLTHRRFVALYPIGFGIIVCDDGRSQFRVWDDDGLAERMDAALAGASEPGGAVHWILYDRVARACRVVCARESRVVLRRQQCERVPA